MAFHRLTIVGAGLIGASTGLALRAQGFSGDITAWDRDPTQLEIALKNGAIDRAISGGVAEALDCAAASDIVLLAVPVLAILDWMDLLSPRLSPPQLVTDVGSVKEAVVKRAVNLFGGFGQPGFLPGHPMAGKEAGGAAHAEAGLFAHAVWLFTPFHEHPLAAEWRGWVERFECRTLTLDPAKHDEICAWVSHLPQMVATGLSALLEERFGGLRSGGPDDPRAIGGRALREMTRLGASPYSMWRDVAQTNSGAIADALLALEQKLAHLRENLKSPELRDEFAAANRFRRQA